MYGPTVALIAVVLIASNERVDAWKMNAGSTKFDAIRQQGVKILGSLVIASTLVANIEPQSAIAYDRLNAATAAGTRVNSDPESLLRYGLPITNDKEIRDIQNNLETCKMNLKTRRVNFAQGDIKNVRTLLAQNENKIMKTASPSKLSKAQAAMDKFKADLDPLEALLSAETGTGSGSVQERSALDGANKAQKQVSRDLTALEELLVPDGFKREIPSEYAGLPVLQGRAEVEMVFKKPDGTQYNVDGNLYDSVKLKLVIDGYNAPLTGGNFVDLIDKGYYTKKVIDRSDGFVVQMGDNDPAGEVHGYKPAGASEERKIPLEISLKGDKELIYGITGEDTGRGAAAATLPFQSYGALGMARSEFEADSASTQFFWLLFESDLTPAGKNLLDGRYSCFGYTIEGQDLLKDVKEGDVVVSAKVVKGLENLKR